MLGIAQQPATDPRAEWNQAIATYERRGLSRPAAIVAVMKEQPAIRKAYDGSACL